MGLDHLNEEEKNILLQVSYFDLPIRRYQGLTVEEILFIRIMKRV